MRQRTSLGAVVTGMAADVYGENSGTTSVPVCSHLLMDEPAAKRPAPIVLRWSWMRGSVTSIGDMVHWDRPHIPAKNPDSSTDVDVGVDDGRAFDMEANWHAEGENEHMLIHETTQHSLWSIRGGTQLAACSLAHYGQNVWARVGICFEPLESRENLFSDYPALRGRKEARTAGDFVRTGFHGICLHQTGEADGGDLQLGRR